MNKLTSLLAALLLWTVSYAQLPKKTPAVYKAWPRNDADALLRSFRQNKLLDSLLTSGSKFYDDIHLDEASVSRNAFLFGYLGKTLNDLKKININHNSSVSWPFNSLLMVVDFTKTADQKRMVIVDLRSRKLLFHTWVSHGKGKVSNFEDPAEINPRFFSNTNGANLSSLGFMVTGGPKPPGNPCHFCRLNINGPVHDEQLYLQGFEQNFNDRVNTRAILVHTTGSKDLSAPAIKRRLRIDNADYRVDEPKGRCYFEKDKSSTVYASKVYIDSTGYIGRSDGCFVVPEEEHLAITQAIRRGTLIFSYSDVSINVYDYDYLKNSPVLNSIRALATY